MLLVAAGDAHGRLDRLYADVLAFERELGRTFAHVLHVGDLGVWPDPARVDRATREHDGAGDFAAWQQEQRAAPRPTTFIQGNHEDFLWLAGREGTEVLPGLRYLANGMTISTCDIAVPQACELAKLRVGGVGGCFGPSAYCRPPRALTGGARRHYASAELELLCASGPLDVVLFHDAPKGIEFVKRMRSGDERRYVSQAEGLSEALGRIQPKVCFFGHHHARLDALIEGVRCVGLNAVGYPGSLVAFEVDQSGAALLGEWPRRKEKES